MKLHRKRMLALAGFAVSALLAQKCFMAAHAKGDGLVKKSNVVGYSMIFQARSKYRYKEKGDKNPILQSIPKKSADIKKASLSSLKNKDYVIFREVHDFGEYREGILEILPELDKLGFKRFCFELIPPRYESDIKKFIKTGKMPKGLKDLLYMIVRSYGVSPERGTREDNSYVRLFNKLRELGWSIEGIYWPWKRNLSAKEYVKKANNIYRDRIMKEKKTVVLIGRNHDLNEYLPNSTDVLLWNRECEKKVLPAREAFQEWEYEAIYPVAGKNPKPGFYKMGRVGEHTPEYVLVVNEKP